MRRRARRWAAAFPTAVADLHEGETVLDLGSGAGADVLISARRVGPAGRVIGLDMTDEMLELARANAGRGRRRQRRVRQGLIEEMPLADETVDVVISNCVINLSGDKGRVIRRRRVCCVRADGSPSRRVADEDMDAAPVRTWPPGPGCIAGALTRPNSRPARGAGFANRDPRDAIACTSTPGSAIIRARKPSSVGVPSDTL